MSQPDMLRETVAPLPGDDATPAAAHLSVAVVGLGYVGLPTALGLHGAGMSVVGLDISEQRLRAIRAEEVELRSSDARRLRSALAGERLQLTTASDALGWVNGVVICAPTPVDEDRRPDPAALRAACESAVAHARPGQTIVLTSTTYVGCTRELLVEPLAERGLVVGKDVAVAFAPERILPGDTTVEHSAVPRVVGGTTPTCVSRARTLLDAAAARVHPVSSLEAAEATKLYENTFRAVNLAFANEMAGVMGHYGLDPVEIVEAASTKPYGFLLHYPGPGVGGHCIPVDPHYLLQPMRGAGVPVPIAENALASIALRPSVVARRALDILSDRSVSEEEATVLIVGMAYKSGVADARESPGLAVADRLERAGVQGLAYHDPFVPSVRLGSGRALRSLSRPDPTIFDLVVVTTVHGSFDHSWLDECEHVLDATYRVKLGRRRHLV